MATSQKQKYIAEGFLEDASVLLNEFVDLNTVEFADFSPLWRKHHFSLVFMGRPDHTETSEFVNEIFRITSQFLISPSFYHQVGGVYILYALFRNQISEPKIKIRIEMIHWRVIKSLREEAILKKYKTLHYVIDFLMNHALLFVANQTLKGPLSGNMPKISKYDEVVCNLKTTYNSEIKKYAEDNNLATLRDLQMQYTAEKKNICDAANLTISDSHKIYEESIKELHKIVDPFNVGRDGLGVTVGAGVGDRRAKLKAQSFMTKTKNRFGVVSDEEVEMVETDPNYESLENKPIRMRKQRRVPKEERKVGRPSRKPKIEPPPEPKSDDEVDISHLLPQQSDFYLPPLNYDSKKVRTKRDPYYQVSPKRNDSGSDYNSD